MRSFHGSCVCYRLLAISLVFSTLAVAGNSPPPKISKETRQEIVHAFNEELVYIRANLAIDLKMDVVFFDDDVADAGPVAGFRGWSPERNPATGPASATSSSKKTTSILRSMAVPSRSRSGTSTSRFQVRAHQFRLRLLIRPRMPAALSWISTSTSMFRR